MATETEAQKKTVERVMHEFKHGELDSGPNGEAGKVRNPKQAIAIALSEAGLSNQKTARPPGRGRNRAELYAEAQRRDLPGRSKMTKAQLEKALS